MRLRHLVTRGAALVALASTPFLLGPGARGAAPPVDSTCNTVAAPSSFTSGTLDAFTPTRAGVTWDSLDSSLRLDTSGGIFNSTSLGTTDLIVYTCAADFDGDGWTDFVGASENPEFIRFYKNRTYENPAPDWTDPTAFRTPKFVMTTEIQAPVARSASRGSMICGDFNNDGFQDFLYTRIEAETGIPNRANHYRGKGDGTFQAPKPFVASLSTLQRTTWPSTNAAAYDYNGDSHLDLIWGAGTPLATDMVTLGGDVMVLLNDGNNDFKFAYSGGDLVSDALFNFRGPVAVAFQDFTGDGIPDLLAGGPSTNKLALYPGLLGGGVDPAFQSIPFNGGACVLLAADFSGDGRPDFMIGTDNFNWPLTTGFLTTGHEGGKLYYYLNDGDSQPFSGGPTQQLTNHVSAPDSHVAGALYDYDTGFLFDYDHDPDSTLDVMIADGNNANTFYVFANRKLAQYVNCGTVASGVLDLGPLASVEMTVTEVRLDPSVILGGGTVTWEASNDNGLSWQTATPCVDDPTEVCATFPTTVGNQIRWRATLCSNAFRTSTPRITSVDMEFTYVTAENHFRSGPIARDGMIYVGATRQPGDAGHFFGIADDTGTTLWDAGPKLTALPAAQRNMYTVSSTGVRQDFSTASATDASFRATINVPDATSATTLVDWQQSARFGLSTPGVLGGIENSTAALLTPPQAPYWYVYTATSAAERTAIDAYITANQNRPQLVFVGAKDGALHAFRTNPAASGDASNGTEAWAFIPYDVAQRMEADRVAGLTPQAYPDGSPTLASAKIGGAWRTVLVSGEGNGGHSVYALDVDDTIDQVSGTVNGPTPLWRFTDPNMGKTYSKPAVIRTKVATVETWLAVFASGKDVGDKGDTVYAVDMTTGAEVWRFEINDTNCYVATDITASDTNDEPGTSKDGFIDRLFFADTKGRVWKVDPATGLPVSSTVSVGLAVPALFSTDVTPGALGEERAIAGTIAAAEDQSGRTALYFGTGGTEETPNSAQNMFFAVYADTGEVRSTIIPAPGVKYYGGVAFNDGQLVFSDGTDLSGLGLCAPTAGEVVAVDANTFAVLFTIPIGSKIMAPIYIQNGEFYTINMRGELVTSPYVPPAGGGGPPPPPPPGMPPGSSGGGTTVLEQPFTLLQWRQEL